MNAHASHLLYKIVRVWILKSMILHNTLPIYGDDMDV